MCMCILCIKYTIYIHIQYTWFNAPVRLEGLEVFTRSFGSAFFGGWVRDLWVPGLAVARSAWSGAWVKKFTWGRERIEDPTRGSQAEKKKWHMKFIWTKSHEIKKDPFVFLIGSHEIKNITLCFLIGSHEIRNITLCFLFNWISWKTNEHIPFFQWIVRNIYFLRKKHCIESREKTYSIFSNWISWNRNKDPFRNSFEVHAIKINKYP